MGRNIEYSLSDGVLALLPGFRRGVIFAVGVRNESIDPGLAEELDAEVRTVRDSSGGGTHSQLEAWSLLYASVPSISDAVPSIVGLVNRLKQSRKPFPYLSSLVAISNLVSLRFRTPSGLVDAARVSERIGLTFASGTESFLPFGRDRFETPVPGEIIYKDFATNRALCRKLSSKGSQEAMVSAETTVALIDVDALDAVIPKTQLEAVLRTASELVGRVCNGRIETAILDATSPTHVFET